MGPHAQIQSDVKARLQTSILLAPIAMELEELGDITARIEKRLIQKGVDAGTNNKLGLAILIITPKGRAADPFLTQSQLTTVRVSLFCNPVINKSAQGHGLAPLDVHSEIQRMMISWYRDPNQPVKLKNWDSMENNRGEISYFSDFDVPHVVDLTPIYPDMPIVVADSQLLPTVEESGAITKWPFRDQVTGQIVYVRIKNSQFHISDT